jgi:ABC-type Fe3+-siderophore transport system permease subunit
MLLIDLAASLGALTGAAAASPLLLVREKESAARNRLWLAGIATGTVIGAGIGWLSTRNASATEKGATTLPYFSMDPADPSRGTRSSMSLGVQGSW